MTNEKFSMTIFQSSHAEIFDPTHAKKVKRAPGVKAP